MNKVLVVEDDKYISNFVGMSLKEEGYEVVSTAQGKKAIEIVDNEAIDIIILDLGLPDMDGIDVIKKVREHTDTPIIVVSARLDERDRITALDLGANDYVVKPFYMGELLARLRVAKRYLDARSKEEVNSYKKGALLLNFNSRQVFLNEQEVHLTPIEFNLLKLLVNNRGKVLTHNFIQKEIWGYCDASNQNALRVFMATLRRKIEENPSSPQYIITEVGVGYRFKE